MTSHIPLISVVTPFRDTAPYLAQCIESVLSQSHQDFEYILSDNCSSDGSTEIAEEYARRDARIRVIRQPQLLSQVRHYNQALSHISAASQYCKIVQADDYLFPDCLRLMAEAFAQSETIGLISAYDLKGNKVRGSGFPYPATVMPGSEVARLYLRNKVFVFGSPNTVMYRSSLVRGERPFFAENLLHEDTEKCFEILRHWDFGFVRQVLSFMRTGNVNQSVSATFRDFRPDELDRYINVHRYASVFLEDQEAKRLKSETRREYYRGLASEAIYLRGVDFWKYQEKGLNTVGETLDRRYLTLQIGRILLGMLLNPGTTMMRLFRFLKCLLRAGGANADHRVSSAVLPDTRSVAARFQDVLNADR